MKRLCLPVLLVFCLLLSGCGTRAAKKQYEEFSQTLEEKTSLSFVGELCAKYEDKSVEFTLQYQSDENGCTVTVLEPELLAGVSAHIAKDSTALEYDGMIIDTGELDSYGLSPMSALPVLVEAMMNGHLDSHWEEAGQTVLKLVLNDHLTASVWFDKEMIPTAAELISDGRVTVSCEISDWN